jgi:hypothetical protein
MNRIALAFVSLACAAAIAAPVAGHAASQGPAASPTASMDGIAQRLIADEKASWDLAIKRDAVPYKALHAADFFTLTGTGVVDKKHSEDFAMDASVHFDQCDLSAFDVHVVAEDAVLLTYHVKAAGLDRGNAFHVDSYASSLWMKRQGAWTNVFYQSTPAPAG